MTAGVCRPGKLADCATSSTLRHHCGYFQNRSPAMNAKPRRILLAVTGLTPQVVTETLYALACCRSEGPWVPHELRLITTLTGAENARLNLLGGKARLHQLCKDYNLPPIAFAPEDILVISDTDGAPLDDFRSPEQNTAAADFITNVVRELTADEGTELHVSIAGGRKTLGYYLGYALSLFGRPQDRLSHVLVSEPYETQREFYYPTPYEHPIHVLIGGKEVTVDARNARVDLAEIPYVRLRAGLPARLTEGSAAFSEVVAAANLSNGPPMVEIDVAKKCVTADGVSTIMPPTPFMLYLWAALRTQARLPANWADMSDAHDFLMVSKRVINPNGGPFVTMERAIKATRGNEELLSKYFEPHKSKANKYLVRALGTGAAQRYEICLIDAGRGVKHVGLLLGADQIRIVWSNPMAAKAQQR